MFRPISHTRLVGFFRREEGATVIEYALLLALVALVLVAAFVLIGDETSRKLSNQDLQNSLGS
jgi:Flp pilus assembly pilin Flp